MKTSYLVPWLCKFLGGLCFQPFVWLAVSTILLSIFNFKFIVLPQKGCILKNQNFLMFNQKFQASSNLFPASPIFFFFFLLIIAYNHIANAWTRACLHWWMQAGLSTLHLWSQSRAETLKYKVEIPATLVPSFAQPNTTGWSSMFCGSSAGRIFLAVNLQRRKSIAFQTCIAAAASLPQNQLYKWHKIKMFHEVNRIFFFPWLPNWFLISLFAM